jgi:tetratricopeptide (TPR) repeat protein
LNPSHDQYLRDGSQLALALLRDEIATGSDADPTRTQNLVATSIQLAQRAAQVAPDEAVNWRNLGVVYQTMTGIIDNVEQLAEDAFAKGAQLRPGDPTFDNQIGQMWLTRADLIRRIAPNNTAAYQDSLTRAETAFKRAIEMSPSYGLAFYNLGAVYDRQNKVGEAIAQLEKIAPYNANEPSLVFELGLLYIRAGRFDNAEAAMRRAVLLAPKFANARWYLALLLERNGDLDGALAQLQEILKDNADNAVLKAKIAQLQAGQQAIPPAEVIDTEPLE